VTTARSTGPAPPPERASDPGAAPALPRPPASSVTGGHSGLSGAQRADLDAHIGRELDRALARVAALADRFDDIVAAAALDAPDDEHDPDGSTVAYERAQVDALLARARRHVTDLRLARERLGDDTCARCGGRITFERLMARPTTRHCVDCAAISR